MRRLTGPILIAAMMLLLAACGSEKIATSGASTGKAPQDYARPSKSIEEIQERYVGLNDDELEWEYNSKTKTLTISGKGPMRDYIADEPDWDVYNEDAEHVVIGDDITAVGAGAFWVFSGLTDVKLGKSVEYIGDNAFDFCDALTTVNFPDSLKYIGDMAFNNAILHSDKGFVLPDGMLYLGQSAFRSAFKEKFVQIPASLTTIGEFAFANCYLEEFRVDKDNPAFASVDGVLYSKDMKTLCYYPAQKSSWVFEIPDTVTTILSEAIETTFNLEKIVIPMSVTDIEDEAIFWNYGLKYIEVDDFNKKYDSDDGVLFSRDGTELICYPIASDRTEYTVPVGTEIIYPYAFSQAYNLEEVYIEEGVKEIGEYAFYGDLALESIGLPSTLENVDESAFDYCDAVTKITYASDRDSWDMISFEDGNDIFTSVDVDIYFAQ